MRVLLVASIADEWLAHGKLQERLDSAGCDVDTAGNAQKAVKRLEEDDYELILVTMRLAPEGGTAAAEDGGLRFCRSARQWTKATIVCINAASNSPVESELFKLVPPPIPLAIDEYLVAKIMGIVQGTDVVAKRLDVVLTVKKGGDWDYDLHGTGFKWGKKGTVSGKLPVNDAEFDTFGVYTNMVEKMLDQDWSAAFSQLSTHLTTTICGKKDFKRDLDNGIEKVKKLANTRVIFVVGEEHYPIALEAIGAHPDHHNIPEPWMLVAPMVRRVNGYTPRTDALFEGRRHPLRVLIVCAHHTQGIAQISFKKIVRNVELDELTHVRAETEALKALLEQSVAAGEPVCKPEILGGEGQPAVTRTALLDALRTSWDVVHFAGHSEVRGDLDSRAYLFVSNDKGQPEAIPMTEVGPYLSKSSLVYLSSCQSGSSAFALEAAKSGVPSVIGFRWEVSDDRAEEYAKRFYEELIPSRSVDQAFLAARRQTYKSHPQDTTWASAMLVTSDAG